MTEHSTGNGTLPAGSSVNEEIHEIFTSGNEFVVNELSTLLIKTLRKGDDDSRSALRQFFGLPAKSQTQSHGAEIDPVLISSVRLFTNGTNANCVETWIAAYETSPRYSQRRSILEQILHAFVESRSETESMKSQLADARKLRADIKSRLAEASKLRADSLAKSATLIKLFNEYVQS